MKLASFFLLPLIVFVSCKKEKARSFTGCRVKTIKKTVEHALLPGTANYVFTYNNEGNVQQIALSGTESGFKYNLVKLFKYTSNTVMIANMSDKQIMSTDSLTLDASGHVVAISNKRSNGTLEPDWKEYSYDHEGQMIVLTYHSLGKIVSVDSAFWENGKMVSYRHNTPAAGFNAYDSYQYSYYDTVYNLGIIHASVDDLVTYGRGIICAGKLESSKFGVVYKWTMYNRSYKLDTDGKILKIVQDDQGAGITTWELDYDCR